MAAMPKPIRAGRKHTRISMTCAPRCRVVHHGALTVVVASRGGARLDRRGFRVTGMRVRCVRGLTCKSDGEEKGRRGRRDGNKGEMIACGDSHALPEKREEQ